METITVNSNGNVVGNGGGQMIMIQQGPGSEPQVMQILSLKDAQLLTKAMASMHEIKNEDTIIEN
jgi:nuclear respiratory factor 1